MKKKVLSEEESEIIKETIEEDSIFDIEKKIISALFDQPNFISYASSRLISKDFNHHILRLCFHEIVNLYNENEKVISINLVKDHILNNDLIIDNNDLDELFNELKYSIPLSDIEEFKQLVDIKKADAIKRNLMGFADNYLSNLNLNTANIEETLNTLNREFFFITSSWITNIEGKNSKYLLEQFDIEVKNKINTGNIGLIDNKFNSHKYNWCLTSIYQLLDGFNKEQLYILAARPGVGKTTLALNWATAYAKMAYEKNLELNQTKDKKHVVLVFSLEMSAIQIFDKIISLVSYVDYYKIKKRQLQVNEQAKLKSILRQEHLEDLPIIFYDDGSLSLSKIESIVKENNSKYVIDLVVIDYLQLIKISEDKIKYNMTRANEVAVISKALKTMALNLKIPVLALSQLSRRVEGNNNKIESKKPLLSDLRESGAIEQDADVVMFLYVDDQAKEMLTGEEGKETYGITFAVEKNRFGNRGVRELEFAKYCSRFDDNGIIPVINED